jgi:phosphopantothenoylcysteine decarboxylase/phosphopantothenate--cysteine ligase
VLITAGPTQEAIDPVRYLGNHSTGKMGIAIADEMAIRGAKVDLVLGPTTLRPGHPSVNTIHVSCSEEMYKAALENFDHADYAILAAAVADYRPASVSSSKIKKGDEALILSLKKTKDIAAHLGGMKKSHQTIVGFALETDDAINNARKKLVTKNFDFIVLNSMKDVGAGFGHDTNKVSFIYPDNKIREFKLKSKKDVAVDIVDAILELTRIHDDVI